VSGQLHAPAALPPGEEPPVPIGYEAAWATEPVWSRWRREKFLVPSSGIEPPNPDRLVRDYVSRKNGVYCSTTHYSKVAEVGKREEMIENGGDM
jgi:hypothetical protein